MAEPPANWILPDHDERRLVQLGEPAARRGGPDSIDTLPPRRHLSITSF